MMSRQPPTRSQIIVGAVFTSLLFLFFFHGSNPGLNGLGGRPAELRRFGRKGKLPNSDIFNSTLGFEKIFVIGLPTRTDRRDGIILQAAVSNMEIDFIDGVKGDTVPDKAIPIGKDQSRIGNASIGSWRAHMNAVQEIVHRNLSSALILEDDVDWDIRLKQQLYDFSLASRALTQPLSSSPSPSPKYTDPTFNRPPDMMPNQIPTIKFDSLPSTIAPIVSPYGDDWDLLWLGHCGVTFPFDRPNHDKLPKGRVIHFDDVTVPPKGNLWSLNKPFTLVKDYPEHTRAIHHTQEGVCSLGYAISQRGARKLLYEVGLKDVSDGFDILLRFFCEGGKAGRKAHTCLTAQPGYFQHHRALGPTSHASDIGDHKGGYREKGLTDMIRWSVRLNLEALMDGKTDGFVDQFPDKKTED
ncbi:glycosyltransferase family 25 protein [Rhypophila sp. PSN 637]